MARITHRGGESYTEGLRTSIRNNAPAYGFSIMITATFGVATALVGTPRPWEVFLYATGALVAFVCVESVATFGFRAESTEGDRTEMLFLAAALNSISVLGGVGAGAFVPWLLTGWPAWLCSSLLATVVFLLLNGIEFTLAAEEEEDGASRGSR